STSPESRRLCAKGGTGHDLSLPIPQPSEGTMKEIRAFECGFCPRFYRRKNGATRHENKCWRNPARRACITCGHFTFEQPEPADWGTGYPGSPGGPFCEVGIIETEVHVTHRFEATSCERECRQPGQLRVLCPSWI